MLRVLTTVSAIAYGVGRLNGKQGLEGWGWLFIIEGFPSSGFHRVLPP
jgi:hypothetical protein